MAIKQSLKAALLNNVGDDPGLVLELLFTFNMLYAFLYVVVVIFIIVKTNWKLSMEYILRDKKEEQ